MKTFLKIVGIGCGVLLLVLLVGSLVLAKACGTSISELFGGARKVAEVQRKLDKLDRDFPFTAPPDDHAIRLEEGRLVEYLAIRKSAFDILTAKRAELQALGKELEAKKTRNEQPTMVEMKRLMTLGMASYNETRGAYATGLAERAMSPTEFRAITATLYGGDADSGAIDPAQREALDQQIAQKKVDYASELDSQRRTLIDAELKALMAQRNAFDGLSGTGDPAVLSANSDLIRNHKAEIDALRDKMLDGFLSGKNAPGAAPFAAGATTEAK